MSLHSASWTPRRLAFQCGGALEGGDGRGDVSQGEARRCPVGNGYRGPGFVGLGGELQRVLRVLGRLSEASGEQFGVREVLGLDKPALRGPQNLTVREGNTRPGKIAEDLRQKTQVIDEDGLVAPPQVRRDERKVVLWGEALQDPETAGVVSHRED